MASSAILSAQQSQVTASMTVREESTNWGGVITNIQLLPRLGQAQLVRVDIKLTNSSDASTVSATVDVLLKDKAFEEFGLFGENKDAKKNKKEAGDY